MKKLLTSAAFVALLAGTPALAEDTTAAPMTPPAATTDAMAPAAPAVTPVEPAAPAMSAPADATAPLPNADATTPSTAEAPAPAVADPAAAPADVAAAPAAATPKYIDKQAAEEQLASNWIGQSVYNSADENLGDVNDLVVGKDGKLDAIVIGVGGFLGIGEKNVAVPFDAVTAATDADGNVKLTIQATKEELDAAPEYMTVAELKSQAAPVTDPTAAPMAPAAPAPAQ